MRIISALCCVALLVAISGCSPNEQSEQTVITATANGFVDKNGRPVVIQSASSQGTISQSVQPSQVYQPEIGQTLVDVLGMTVMAVASGYLVGKTTNFYGTTPIYQPSPTYYNQPAVNEPISNIAAPLAAKKIESSTAYSNVLEAKKIDGSTAYNVLPSIKPAVPISQSVTPSAYYQQAGVPKSWQSVSPAQVPVRISSSQQVTIPQTQPSTRWSSPSYSSSAFRSSSSRSSSSSSSRSR